MSSSGPVVSEEMFENVDRRRTDDGRTGILLAHSELKNQKNNGGFSCLKNTENVVILLKKLLMPTMGGISTFFKKF